MLPSKNIINKISSIGHHHSMRLIFKLVSDLNFRFTFFCKNLASLVGYHLVPIKVSTKHIQFPTQWVKILNIGVSW